MRVRRNYLSIFVFLSLIFFLANEESIIKMVADDNEQERYLKYEKNSFISPRFIFAGGCYFKREKKKLLIRQ
jgi:hypothetical protein